VGLMVKPRDRLTVFDHRNQTPSPTPSPPAARDTSVAVFDRWYCSPRSPSYGFAAAESGARQLGSHLSEALFLCGAQVSVGVSPAPEAQPPPLRQGIHGGRCSGVVSDRSAIVSATHDTRDGIASRHAEIGAIVEAQAGINTSHRVMAAS